MAYQPSTLLAAIVALASRKLACGRLAGGNGSQYTPALLFIAYRQATEAACEALFVLVVGTVQLALRLFFRNCSPILASHHRRIGVCVVVALPLVGLARA